MGELGPAQQNGQERQRYCQVQEAADQPWCPQAVRHQLLAEDWAITFHRDSPADQAQNIVAMITGERRNSHGSSCARLTQEMRRGSRVSWLASSGR